VSAAFVTYKGVKSFADKQETNRKRKLLEGQETIVYDVDVWGGEVKTQTVDLGAIAVEIYDSFYQNDWFGWTENEQAAINALQKVPKANIPKLEDIYYKAFKEILRVDFVKFLTNTDFQRIKNKFN